MKKSILVINDSQCDPSNSITYQKSKVSVDYNMQISLNDLYQEFLIEPDNIFSYDTKGCFSFIIDDNKEISLYEYKQGMNIRFIKITNDDLHKDGNDILVGINPDKAHYEMLFANWCNWYIIKNYNINLEEPNKYNSYTDFVDALKQNYNGYDDTLFIYNTYKKAFENTSHSMADLLPAFDHCLNQKVNIGNKIYQGYLPSAGQLYIISKYYKMLNHVYQYTGFDFAGLMKHNWWTSARVNSTGMWRLDNGKLNYAFKFQSANVLPLFKEMANENI